MRKSAVDIGQELQPFQRVTDFANWNRFAAVNDEFIPIHMDDGAAQQAGLPAAVGMGNLQWAYLHNLIRDWLGPSDEILRLSCQFRGVNTRGMTVTARGFVADVRQTDAGRVADLEVWTEDQNGTKLVPGKATIALGD